MRCWSEIKEMVSFGPPSKTSLTPALEAQPDNTERNQHFNSFSTFCQIPDTKMQIIVTKRGKDKAQFSSH